VKPLVQEKPRQMVADKPRRACDEDLTLWLAPLCLLDALLAGKEVGCQRGEGESVDPEEGKPSQPYPGYL
jgi:hypothetical protein